MPRNRSHLYERNYVICYTDGIRVRLAGFREQIGKTRNRKTVPTLFTYWEARRVVRTMVEHPVPVFAEILPWTV